MLEQQSFSGENAIDNQAILVIENKTKSYNTKTNYKHLSRPELHVFELSQTVVQEPVCPLQTSQLQPTGLSIFLSKHGEGVFHLSIHVLDVFDGKCLFCTVLGGQ